MIGSNAIEKIQDECDRGRQIYIPMRSIHEGYALLLEEMDELWDEIKKKEIEEEKIAKEASHVGAMALRFLQDLC